MPSQAMVVDVVPYKWFGLVGAFAAALLVASLLVGSLGPSTYQYNVQYAYKCPGGSHNWTPTCSGVQLMNGGTWTYDMPHLETLNGFWSLAVFPFSTNSSALYEKLLVNITIQGRNNNQDSWSHVAGPSVRSELLLCDKPNAMCWGFVLAYEDSIKYSYYQVKFSLPTENNDARFNIGDVGFQFSNYNVNFVEEELTIRVTFLVLATIAIFAFWLRMRHSDLDDWTIEQKFLGILLLMLVCLNNPFYPFEYLVAGSFFPILDAALQVGHSAVLMIFWLVIFDHLRRGGTEFTIQKWDWIKPAVIGAYSLLTFSFFVWFRVSRQVDPIFGDAGKITGLVVLFFISALFFGAIMVWILVTLMLTIPAVWTKRVLTARFMYLAVPTAVCLFSVVIGLFFGSFGPVRRRAVAFCYFFTLYNVYVWVLLIGYWPLRTTFGVGTTNATEGTPIYSVFHQETQAEPITKEYADDTM